MCFLIILMAPFSHLYSHHFPSPLSTSPHHSPSALRSHSPLLTPFPIITSHHSPHPYSHHSPLPHYLSLLPSLHPLATTLSTPLATLHHPSSPTLLTTFSPHRFTTPLPTYLPTHTFSPHPLTPPPHHS